MVVVLVAGMSGTGKSTVLLELARRGYRVVDTDYGGWSEDVPVADGSGTERLWRQDKIDALLADHAVGALFLAGCGESSRVLSEIRRNRPVERTAGRDPRASDVP
jgi:hypothetical protein